MMKTIKFKKLNNKAVMPKKAHPTDAGFDIIATSRIYQGECYVYSTGIAIQLPKDHVALIFPRSSISKTGLILSNSVGVIDAGYTGEIMFKFRPTNSHPILYNVGDRIGQMVILPLPQVKFKEVKELFKTDRGNGGFGSTGK